MYKFTSRNPHGNVIITEPERNAREFDTNQCPHCGGHFIIKQGSGMRRTFCVRCMAVTCGRIECDPCRPFEKWLEQCECNSK